MKLRIRHTLFAAALVVAAAVVAPAIPASAVPGLQRVSTPFADNSEPHKIARAVCPSYTDVIGGGGYVVDHGAGRVVLNALVPVVSPGDDYYEAIATAPPGFTHIWSLQAYAICAPPGAVRHLNVKFQPSDGGLTSSTFRHAEAVCPAGQKVLGSGAEASGNAGYTGELGLQLVRSSGPLDIVRATAREDADGYAYAWAVTAVAVCADPVPGQVAAANVVTSATGHVTCPPSAPLVHGAGGGGSVNDSGPTFLQGIIPDVGLHSVTTMMTTTPTAGMVTAAVCAN
jgi:hypothetical protein